MKTFTLSSVTDKYKISTFVSMSRRSCFLKYCWKWR